MLEDSEDSGTTQKEDVKKTIAKMLPSILVCVLHLFLFCKWPWQANLKLKLNISSLCFNHHVLGGLYDYQLTRFTEWLWLHLQTALHVLSVGIHKYTSFTAALAIHTYNTTSPGSMHIHPRSMFCVIPPDLGCSRVVFIFHGKLLWLKFPVLPPSQSRNTDQSMYP